MINRKNNYLIKKKDGTELSFIYGNNSDILYNVLKDGVRSNCNIFKQNVRQNFSAALTGDDDIYVMHDDVSGNILLDKYGTFKTHGYKIYEKENKSSEVYYMDALCYGDSIYLFYAIKDKYSSSSKIFWRTADKNMNLSSSIIIDDAAAPNNLPFILYASQQGDIYIMYQEFISDFKLGYKVLKKGDKIWSSFYLIDTSSEPFIDYSLLEADNNFYEIYIKKECEKNSLICCFQKDQDVTHIKLYVSEDIKYCSIYRIKRFIWVTWISNKQLFCSFSAASKLHFSYPYYEKKLCPINIIKVRYLSNFTDENNDTNYSNIYAYDNVLLKKSDFLNVYTKVNHYNKNITYYYIYYLEKAIEELDQDKKHSCAICNAEKDKIILCEKKSENPEKIYSEFSDMKESLSKGIQTIKQNIKNKNNYILQLRIALKQKENEIELMKKQIENMAVTKTR